MADELEALWKNLSFTEEEDEKIVLASNSTKAAKERGKNCLVMKVLSRRSIALDAIRKNLRMVWKPNKGLQIMEVGEELFIVKFGDEKDKKKVLDMSPWNYEKQLILLQEFEGEQAPTEITLKWSPFWIQIHNLPLKSRTRETGRAIGSTLGEVLDIDVAEFGVQWGKYLRVRVRVDVTKKLIRGKKVAIEGDESRWVQFKYECLPNFCYNCGVLSNDMKDCPELATKDKQPEVDGLQYGAWLRGELTRKTG